MPGVLFLLKCQSIPQNLTENGSGSSSAQGSLTELRGSGSMPGSRFASGAAAAPGTGPQVFLWC